MDRFYLDNTGLYQRLVAAYKPAPGPAAAEETSPDMVVSARVRPLLDQDIAAGFPCAVFPRPDQPGVADVHDLYNHPRGRPVLRSFDYKLDKLFGAQASTDDIYGDLVLDLPPLAWNGGTGTLFAYGQTGSGKTFTVSRLEELVVQALMKGTLPGERQIWMTMVELAGNSAFDLLHSRRPVAILEDSLGVTQLSGADEQLVQGEAEAMRLIKRATHFRRTAPTRKNDSSSRSHGICRIRIADPATGSEGLLYLVDLAGSEAARDVAVHGADRMRETREINISLSVLKDCIRAKAQADTASRKPKKPHVPFRQSALTKVLKHVFDPPAGRACKTVVVACVNPSLGDAGASKNTLRYAEMLRVVLPATIKQPNSDLVAPGAWSNAQLQDWIAKNSGASPILPNIVAPTETGSQFLQLRADSIELRCMQCPGVTTEEAQAFRSKLWQLHVDSQRLGYLPAAPSESPVIRLSSRDPDPQVAGTPFRQRIRPGMAVKWHPASDRALPASLALVLSPSDGDGAAQAGACTQYLCASVTPGQTPGAYEVNLWHQFLVGVDAMEHEVILEYDTASRMPQSQGQAAARLVSSSAVMIKYDSSSISSSRPRSPCFTGRP